MSDIDPGFSRYVVDGKIMSESEYKAYQASITPKVMVLNKFVTIRFQLEGYHHFANAAEICPGKGDQDVSFLEYKHRHIFHFEVQLAVTNSNREYEFFQVQRTLMQRIPEWYQVMDASPRLPVQFMGRSCEMIAEEVGRLFHKIYPKYSGLLGVTVSEDGENGSTVNMILTPDGRDD